LSKLPRAGFNKKYHDKYIYWTKHSKDNEFRFETMADMFIVAAIMGFYLDRKKSFTKEDKKELSIPLSAFTNNIYHMQIIKSICLLHFKDDPRKAELLLDNEKLIEIAQEYANGGITHLLKILEHGTDIVGNLIGMIDEYKTQQ
jgi:dnd system-associated protein 4